MSTPTGIVQTAPVVARHAMDVAAPPARVWELHTAVDRWPTWQPDITAARLDGPFAPGASFEWSTFGMTIVSTIYDVADGERTLWGGTTDDGSSACTNGASRPRRTARGSRRTSRSPATPVAGQAAELQPLLDGALVSWLGHLKAAAEA